MSAARAELAFRREGPWLCATLEGVDSAGHPRRLEARINAQQLAPVLELARAARRRRCCHAAGELPVFVGEDGERPVFVGDSLVFVGERPIFVGAAFPAWLEAHAKNATSADRQRWVGFAMAIEEQLSHDRVQARKEGHKSGWLEGRIKELEGYAKPNGVNTRPDDPFWQATEARRKDRAHFLDKAAKRRWTLHTTFTPLKVIEKIPVLGSITKLAEAPFKLAGALASGERLDHALLGTLKDQVAAVRDLAPYVQTIVSLVPGIGTGVAAAIAAGAALSEGRSITEATMAAVRGAIPGGPLVQAGFDMAVKVAKGENVGKAALETARAQLPKEAQKAFDVGLAVASGRSLQSAVVNAIGSLLPAQAKELLDTGAKAIASTPGLAEVAKQLGQGAEKGGLQLAAGLLAQQGINEATLVKMRSQLEPLARAGFDAALKSQEAHKPWLANVTAARPPPAPALRAAPKPKEPPRPKPAPRVAPKPKEPPARKPIVVAPKPREPVRHAAPQQPVQPRAPVAERAAIAFKSANAMLEGAERGGAGLAALRSSTVALGTQAKLAGVPGEKARRAAEVLRIVHQWRSGLRAAQTSSAERMAARGMVGGLSMPPAAIPDPARLIAAGVRPGTY